MTTMGVVSLVISLPSEDHPEFIQEHLIPIYQAGINGSDISHPFHDKVAFSLSTGIKQLANKTFDLVMESQREFSWVGY